MRRGAPIGDGGRLCATECASVAYVGAARRALRHRSPPAVAIASPDAAFALLARYQAVARAARHVVGHLRPPLGVRRRRNGRRRCRRNRCGRRNAPRCLGRRLRGRGRGSGALGGLSHRASGGVRRGGPGRRTRTFRRRSGGTRGRPGSACRIGPEGRRHLAGRWHRVALGRRRHRPGRPEHLARRLVERRLPRLALLPGIGITGAGRRFRGGGRRRAPTDQEDGQRPQRGERDDGRERDEQGAAPRRRGVGRLGSGSSPASAWNRARRG